MPLFDGSKLVFRVFCKKKHPKNLFFQIYSLSLHPLKKKITQTDEGKDYHLPGFGSSVRQW